MGVKENNLELCLAVSSGSVPSSLPFLYPLDTAEHRELKIIVSHIIAVVLALINRALSFRSTGKDKGLGYNMGHASL